MNIIRRIKEKIREVRWFWQRGRRGWADVDMWNLHSYLEGILADCLPILSEIAHGSPCPYPEDNHPFEDKDGYVFSVNNDCDCFENWKRDLLYHGENFNKLVNDTFLDVDDDVKKGWEEEEKAYKESLSWLQKNWGSLWD